MNYCIHAKLDLMPSRRGHAAEFYSLRLVANRREHGVRIDLVTSRRSLPPRHHRLLLGTHLCDLLRDKCANAALSAPPSRELSPSSRIGPCSAKPPTRRYCVFFLHPMHEYLHCFLVGW